MNYMKKIGSYLLLLVLSAGLTSTLYAYDGKAAGSKRKYNSKVINRVSSALMDAIAKNKTQRKKQYRWERKRQRLESCATRLQPRCRRSNQNL